MKTLIIGAGGVGGYFGARLLQAGFDVTIAARGEHGRALAERGLSLREGERETRVEIPRLALDLESLRERFELILLAVKWPELEAVCDTLPNLITPHGLVAPLLNGLSSEEVVARYVGAQRTLAAVALMSAGLIAPGAIYVQPFARVGFAPFRPGQETDVARVAAMFERAGVPVQRSDDYRGMLWQKMLWNAPFNGVCALTRRPAGECAERLEPLLRRAMREVIAVAGAEGVVLPEQVADVMLQVARNQFPNSEPSMLQDVRKGRPTEVEILQGEVVRRGQAHGVDTPVLTTLADLIRGLSAA